MSDIRQQALQCRTAAQALAQLDTAAKDALLRAMADALDQDAGAILAEWRGGAAAAGAGY